MSRVWTVRVVMCLAAILQASAAQQCPRQCRCRDLVVCQGPAPPALPSATTRLSYKPSDPADLETFLATLADLPKLAELILTDCAIQDLNYTFDGLSLRTLSLSHNQLTSLPENLNQTQLRTLDISHNQLHLQGSPFQQFPSLENLNLSRNAIDSTNLTPCTFSGLQTLITLDLANNNITTLNQTFASLTSLQQLNLSKNQLETLSETCFGNLQRLQQLDLSWNRITHMAPGTLQALPSLSRLMIAGNSKLGGGNKDTALLVGTRRLQTLDASKTGLEHVPAALTHSVRTLRLSGNSIKTIQCGDLDSYPLLQLLDMTTNLLEEMEEDALGRLEMLVILYLTDNKLHAIPRSLPDELKILHLEFNRIEQIVSGDLLGLPKLEVLLLNDNNIKVVQEGAFTQMTSLITLDLSRNPISILPAGTLSGPTRLQVLRLSSLTVEPPAEDMTFPVSSPEHLVRLDLSHSPGLSRQLLADGAALVAFRDLQELNLTDSDLVNVRSDLLHFLPQLRDLHITGNRLNCSGLLWLGLWMRVQDQPEHREVVCVSPPELYGTLVVDLQDTDMEMTERPTRSTGSYNVTWSTETTGYNITWNGVSTSMTPVSNVTEFSTPNPRDFRKDDISEARNRSDVIGIENPNEGDVTTPFLPTDNQFATASNYEVPTSTLDTKKSGTESFATEVPQMMTLHDNESVLFSPSYANHSSSSAATPANTPPVKTDVPVATPVTENPVTEFVNTTTGAATGEMSMYHVSRDSGRSLVHPGMLVLLGAVLGAGAALATVISHVRKRRKRAAADGAYSRQQDIEVDSLPSFSELW